MRKTDAERRAFLKTLKPRLVQIAENAAARASSVDLDELRGRVAAARREIRKDIWVAAELVQDGEPQARHVQLQMLSKKRTQAAVMPADCAEALSSTAYHEAGHAVAAFFLGIKLFKMAIDKGASVAGAVAHQGVEHVLHESLARPNHGFHTKFGRARAEQMLIVSFAGCVAEKRFSGHAEALSGADLAVSIDFLQRLSEDPKVRDTYLHRLTAQAEELLETHWSSVEAVATALLERKTISPAQITAAILD